MDEFVIHYHTNVSPAPNQIQESVPVNSKMNISIPTVLQKTQEMLQAARMGLDDFLSHDPSRKLYGFRNLVVFGRAITNVLQTARSCDRERFDLWYAPIQAEMRSDPLLKYIYDLRSEILKEGTTGVAYSSTYISGINLGHFMNSLPSPPPGATSFFIGDPMGGSGWEISLPDGSIEKYYVALPKEGGITVNLHFENPPTTHLGEPLNDTSIENISRIYIGYMSNLVNRALSELLPE